MRVCCLYDWYREIKEIGKNLRLYLKLISWCYYLHTGGYVFGIVGRYACPTDYSKRDERIGSGQGTIDYILGMIRITMQIHDPHYDRFI